MGLAFFTTVRSLGRSCSGSGDPDWDWIRPPIQSNNESSQPRDHCFPGKSHFVSGNMCQSCSGLTNPDWDRSPPIRPPIPRFRTMFLAMVLGLLCKEVTLVLGDVGTATSYGPPYTPTKCNGNRQDQFPPGNMFVAVSEGLWDNGASCGRRYRLRCLSGSNKPCKDGTIDVEVVDVCSKTPCPSTFLMSTDAFAAVSRFSSGKINIEYVQI